MTRKTAPRAPVCESDTLGGCKDATPGLREEGEGEGEGEGGRAIRNSQGNKRRKTFTPTGRVGICRCTKKKSNSMCLNNFTASKPSGLQALSIIIILHFLMSFVFIVLFFYIV